MIGFRRCIVKAGLAGFSDGPSGYGVGENGAKDG